MPSSCTTLRRDTTTSAWHHDSRDGVLSLAILGAASPACSLTLCTPLTTYPIQPRAVRSRWIARSLRPSRGGRGCRILLLLRSKVWCRHPTRELLPCQHASQHAFETAVSVCRAEQCLRAHVKVRQGRSARRSSAYADHAYLISSSRDFYLYVTLAFACVRRRQRRAAARICKRCSADGSLGECSGRRHLLRLLLLALSYLGRCSTMEDVVASARFPGL